jgi:hypothetical protein
MVDIMVDTGEVHGNIVAFVEMARVVAAPAGEQRAWLEAEGGPPVEEITLYFDDLVHAARAANGGRFSVGVEGRLAAVWAVFDAMAGPKGPWDPEDLDRSPRWSEVRRAAADLLLTLRNTPLWSGYPE